MFIFVLNETGIRLAGIAQFGNSSFRGAALKSRILVPMESTVRPFAATPVRYLPGYH